MKNKTNFIRTILSLSAFGFLSMISTQASAITLTNHDAQEQKLLIIEGDTKEERVLKAGEKIQLCLKSCVIRLSDGEDYEFDGQEIVSLEDGLLFLDSTQEPPKEQANFQPR